jgi:chemotaxis protein MotC
VSRKKLLFVGLLLATVSAAALIGVYLFNPAVTSHLAVGKAEQEHAAEQFVGQEAREQKPRGLVGHEGGDVSAEEKSHAPKLKQDSESAIEVVAAADFVPPLSRSSPVRNVMREISLLQSEMAKGRHDVPQALKAAMLRAQDVFRGMDPSRISTYEIESAAAFVLSGGDPSILARPLGSSTLSEQQRILLEGVASYATADLVTAKEKFANVKLEQLETTLTAQLTMALVQLDSSAEHHESSQRLAFVADVLPGTLIEEAAIRRIIPLLALQAKRQQLLYWTTRYLRRFPNSLYYRDFEASLVKAIVALSPDESAMEAGILRGMFTVAREVRAASLSREIMLLAVQRADTSLCDRVETSLAATFDLGTSQFLDSVVLFKICKVVDGGQQNLQKMKTVDRAKLGEEVKLYLDKAVTMAEAVLGDAPPGDAGSFGPHFPLWKDSTHADLFASVTQQLDVTLAAIRKADDDESSVDKQPQQ